MREQLWPDMLGDFGQNVNPIFLARIPVGIPSLAMGAWSR